MSASAPSPALEALAGEFLHAFRNHRWPGGGADEIARLSIAEAYEVQGLVARKRVEAGERLAGYKVGCTSRAIREQFGLGDPICARLFHPRIHEEGFAPDWRRYPDCAIEPELVMTIGKDLHGTDLPDEALLGAIAHLRPGIEIHHCRFWHTPPTAQELICSGGIHAGLIVGTATVSPTALAFRDEAFTVHRDGKLVTSAPASEIMGGPLHSLRWLVNFLTAKGESLKEGSLVIPGSPVELITIDHDCDLRIGIEKVGSVSARFTGDGGRA